MTNWLTYYGEFYFLIHSSVIKFCIGVGLSAPPSSPSNIDTSSPNKFLTSSAFFAGGSDEIFAEVDVITLSNFSESSIIEG